MSRTWRLSVQLLVLALLLGFAAERVAAQDKRPQDPPPPTVRAVAPRPWKVLAAEDGYTVWRQDVNAACSYNDHNFTLDIPQDPKDMTDISYSMTDYDVDYNDPQGCEGGPEVDHMKFNGRFLGILTGANNSWSLNSWPLQATDIISGSNQIYIDTDAPGTGCWCVGVGYIQVKAKVGFKVNDKTPQDNDKNRDFHKGNLDLTVTFSTEYNPGTLTADTFKLEYRDQGGAWQAVGGSFAQLTPQKFRFVPSADLKDGVRYRATVKSGEAGVKSKAGAKLDSDTVWYFWTVPDLSQTDAYNYGSGSVCPPATNPCPGVDLAVFQVARNVDMVPNKPAVARLYLRWKKQTDVLDADQVKELAVDASITVGGAKTTLRSTVKRPDQYTAAEKQAASNTVNLYHTPTTGFAYAAEVIPSPQTNATPVKYTQNLNLNSKGNSPNIAFPYYFLKDGAWAAGVPAAAKADGVNLLTAGAQFVTDQFPVLNTTFTQKGDYTIGYTYTTGTVNFGNCGVVKEVSCPAAGGPAVKKAELMCAYEKLQTLRGSSKFVAATVPNGLCIGATAFAMGDKVFMHQSGGGGNDGTVAHEIGHIYGISPANNPTNKHRNDSSGVEGFQVRTKINRSYIENRTKAISLMHTTVQAQGTQWVDNNDYKALLGSVNVAAAQSSALATGPYFIIGGYVNPNTNSARLAYAFLQDTPNDPPAATGACRVELLDAGNNVLAGDNVTPGVEIETFGQTGTDQPVNAAQATATNDDPEQYFTVSLPWNNTAQHIRVSCNNTVLLTVDRRAAAPSVDFINLPDNTSLSDVQTLSWTGIDADSTNLAYQLQFFDANANLWAPLTPLSANVSYALDTHLLPSGDGKQLRILVTDGFNTAYATRTVKIINPLTVLGVSPGVNTNDATLDAPISAFFVSDIATPTIQTGVFQVLQNGNPIDGAVKYEAASRKLSFTPATPLNPNTLYTVLLDSGLADTNGNSLDTPYSWNFTTVTDTVPPLISRINPQAGEIDVPLNALIQAQFNEPMDATTLTTTTVQVLDSNNTPVNGALNYDVAHRAVVFVAAAPFAANSTYTVRITTGAKDANGNPLAAPYAWSFTTGVATTANGLRIIGNYDDVGIDRNNDQLFDDLAVAVDVEVQNAGFYNLNGRLVDKNNELIFWASTGDLNLTVGVHRLTLTFQSVPIRSNGVNGPYLLDSLNFYNVNAPEQADVRNRAYSTFPYDVSSFFSMLTLGGLPDQLLEINTTRDNAFNLHNFTTHRTRPLSDVTYTLLVNTNPAVGVSIDAEANVDINPPAATEAESDVTIEAKDPDGNRVLSSFHIGVQKAQAATLTSNAPATLGTNQTLPIQMEIRDQFGRIFTGPVTVTVETTLGTVDPTTLTTSTGVASFNLTVGNSTGPLFVSLKANSAATLLSMTVVEVAVATIDITGPATGVAGTAYNFSATTGPLGATRPITYQWTATTLSPVQTVGELNSSATFQWTKAGVHTVTVAATNAKGNASNTHQITISAAAPASLTVTANPSVIRNDGGSTSTIQVKVLDAFGNPAPNQLVTLVTGPGTLPPAAPTNGDGIATFTVTGGTATGSFTVTAEVNGLRATTSLTVQAQGGGVYLPLIRR